MLRLKKKQKRLMTKEETYAIIQHELGGYVKLEDLQKLITKIQADEKKRQKWEGLSTKKKIKLLKYVLSKKGGQDGKK